MNAMVLYLSVISWCSIKQLKFRVTQSHWYWTLA